ncbi:MAG: hypothetical protein II187_00480 [Treponema sp.]|jgi:hypothetical protein|nr:hypothetical protein [Treponema sp.]
MADIDLEGEHEELIDLSQYKERLIQYGLFSAMLVVFFGLLVLFTLLSRNAWDKGLCLQVEQVLPEDYTIVSTDVLQSPFVVSCASFSLVRNTQGKSAGTDEGLHAVIIRVMTSFGPFPMVFLYDERKSSADFVCLLTGSSRVEDSIISSARNSQIAYWERRIPKIVRTAEVHTGGAE